MLKERDEHGDERTLDTIENMDADPQALDRFEEEFRSARGGRGNLLGYEQPQQRRRRTPMIGPAYDFDQDGLVGSSDLMPLLANYGLSATC